MFFIVFGSTRVQDTNPISGRIEGPPVLMWGAPIGVFQADTAEAACKRAAKKVGYMGNFFAVEGSPWGVELLEDETTGEFGVDDMNVHDINQRTRELERSVGMRHDGSWVEDEPA